MKTSLRKLTNAILLVALGASAWLTLPSVRKLVTGGIDETPQLQELPPGAGDMSLPVVQVEGAEGDDAGNIVLAACLVAIERRASLKVDLLQSGTIAGQIVETSGAYLQKGAGDDRRFSMLLQGRVGDATSRVWQVSDGRFLFTDIAWNGGQPTDQPLTPDGAAAGRRRVTRVDLALVRKRFDRARGESLVAPGRAAITLVRPGSWTGQGGLPMLIGALGENFNFAAPRQMSLRNEPVYALIGRWKPERLQALIAATDEEGAAGMLPPRTPNHVLIAIGAHDRFPRLIEYRSQEDPLSAPGLAAHDRFRESRTPLLRMDLLSPQFDIPIADGYFAYQEPEDVEFHDATDDRLRLVENRLPGGTTRQ